MIHYNATIDVDILNCHWSKVFSGTEEELHNEAYDFMNLLISRYISDNQVTDPEQQEAIISCSSYEITWDVEPYIDAYLVSEDGVYYGVFPRKAEAEEMLFTFCEDIVYEIMMTEDPMDMFGKEEYDWTSDWKYLMRDVGSSFHIDQVSLYDMEGYDFEN